MCNVPQQDNTKDCGIFVCLYCNFVLNDCALDFDQNDIRCGEWRKKIVLSILSIDNDDNDDSDPVIASHLTWTKVTEKHVKMPDFNLSKICNENLVIMSAMIIAMAKTNAITRGSNKTNGRMLWKGIQEIQARVSVYFLKKNAGRMILSLSTQVKSPKNMAVFTA
jgi:hypothetical protein